MANIFGILTTLVLIAAILVAAKNKTRYEDELANVAIEKDRLSVSQERLATAQRRVAETEAEIPAVRARTEELVAEAEEQRDTNTRLEGEIQAKNTELARNRERISQFQQTLASFGDVEQLTQSLRSLRVEIAELESPDDGIPARSARVDLLSAQATQIEAENTMAVTILDGYSRGESRPGMTTRIRSLYPNWGFVTLASGGIAGIAGNSTMDVIRDNRIIAKLQITAVEANSATATIVPGSLADDAVLAVNDVVVPGAPIDVN